MADVDVNKTVGTDVSTTTQHHAHGHTQLCGNEYFIRHRPVKNLINENAKQGLIDYFTIIALPNLI